MQHKCCRYLKTSAHETKLSVRLSLFRKYLFLKYLGCFFSTGLVAHLEGWSAVFCASGRSEGCCRTPVRRWRGRKPWTGASDDPALSNGPLPSEPGLVWIGASLMRQMNSPLPWYAHGSPYQMLTRPSCWLSICRSTWTTNEPGGRVQPL